MGRVFAVTTQAGSSDKFLKSFTLSCSTDGAKFSDVMGTNTTAAYVRIFILKFYYNSRFFYMNKLTLFSIKRLSVQVFRNGATSMLIYMFIQMNILYVFSPLCFARSVWNADIQVCIELLKLRLWNRNVFGPELFRRHYDTIDFLLLLITSEPYSRILFVI